MSESQSPSHGVGGYRFHGDQELGPGLVDLAVNVTSLPHPQWLIDAIAGADLAAYPRPASAQQAVAARHRRDPDEVLLTHGAAEAFTLLARVLEPGRAVVVHPQFTEPEAALAAAGHRYERALQPAPFALDPATVHESADLVMIGNPTNPTSVCHPATVLARLARPGRTLVIDEAFADTVPGEPESLAHRSDLPGLVVVRSLTKTWGLAGLRVGYLLAPASLVAKLRSVQPAWPVSAPALAAIEACLAPGALVEARRRAEQLSLWRTHLIDGLTARGVLVVGPARSSFVLVQVAHRGEVRETLRRRGFAVRRGETFPGLGPDWLRIAVREPAVSDALLAAWPA